MAVGTPVHRGDGGGTTSATTGSFTPTADSKLFAFISGYRDSLLSGDPTVTDSLGLTWTLVRVGRFNNAINRRICCSVFVASVGASPSSMTVTGSSTNALETTITVCDVTGVRANYANTTSNGNANGDPSSTLAAFSTGGACIAWAAFQGGNAITPPSGFTEIFDATITANGQSRRNTTAYHLTPSSTTVGFTSTNTQSNTISLELKPELTAAVGASAATACSIDATFIPAPSTAPAIEMDGTTDSLSKASSVSSATSSGWSLVVYLNPPATLTDGYYGIFAATGAGGEYLGVIVVQYDAEIYFNLSFSDGTNNTNGFTEVFSSGGDWGPLHVSCDMNFTTGNKLVRIYFGDADQVPGANDGGDGAWSMDFANLADWYVGDDGFGALYPGKIASLWFDTSYIDWSDSANRRKFSDVSGKLVDLGSDGSLPTGTAPAIYLKFADNTNFGLNSGTGGNFTVNGSPVETTGPVTFATFSKVINAAVSVAVSTGRLAGKAISATAGSSVAMVRGIGKRIAATASIAATLRRSVGKSVAVAASSVVSIAKSVTARIAAGVTALVSVGALKVKTVVIAASVSASASASRTIGKGVAVSAGAAVAVRKGLALVVSMTATAAASIFKAFPVAISAALATSTGLSRSIAKAVAVSVGTVVSAAASVLTNWFPLKVYRGGAWVLGKLRIYRDGGWVKPSIKRYHNGEWVDL